MNTKSTIQLVVAVVIGVALGFFVVTLATQREYPGPSQPVPTEKPLKPAGASVTPTRPEPIVEVTSAVPVKMQLRMVTESRSQSFPLCEGIGVTSVHWTLN